MFHIRIKNFFFVHKFSDFVFPICKFCNNMVVCCMQKQNDSARNNTAILRIPDKPCLGSYQLLICHRIFPAHSCKYIKSIVFYPAKDMTKGPDPAHFSVWSNLITVYGTSELFYEKYMSHSLVVFWGLIMEKYCYLRIKYYYLCLVWKSIFMIPFCSSGT